MQTIGPGKPNTARNYVEAVQSDRRAHPIQAASDVLPSGEFSTAADLYEYTVCPYDKNGRALDPKEPVRSARWIIYDNVYMRQSGAYPQNADRQRGRAVGMAAAGKGRTPAFAAALWPQVVTQWGPPYGFTPSPTTEMQDAPRPAVKEPAVPPARDSSPAPTGASNQSPQVAGDWAQALVGETYRFWQTLENAYPFWRSGFMVFFSPVRPNAGVLILGANPGGDATAFNVPLATSIPSSHDYFTYGYPLAEQMRRLFGHINQTEMLKDSVKLNMNFFRSRDSGEWKTAPEPIRQSMESFSLERVRRIIAAVKPKVIIAEGTAAFDTLRRELAGGPEEVVVRTDWRGANVRGYTRAALPGGTKLIGLVHPSACPHAFNSAFTEIARALANDLRE